MSRKKSYRCPVLNMAAERDDIRDKIRAFVQCHAPGDPAVLPFVHEHDQCDQRAEFVGYRYREVATPSGMRMDQLPKTPTGMIEAPEQRNMVVRCAVHGEVVRSYLGHHVTEKRRKKLNVRDVVRRSEPCSWIP